MIEDNRAGNIPPTLLGKIGPFSCDILRTEMNHDNIKSWLFLLRDECM